MSKLNSVLLLLGIIAFFLAILTVISVIKAGGFIGFIFVVLLIVIVFDKLKDVIKTKLGIKNDKKTANV